MNESERIYALLVEANPVPDPDVLPERLADVEPHLHVVDTEGTTMQTQPATQQPTQQPPNRRAGWIAAAVAAVVVLAVGVAAALLLTTNDSQPVVEEPATTVAPPATTLPPDTSPELSAEDQGRADAAVVKAEDYLAAINNGDADAAAALMSPNESVLEADLRMLNFNALTSERYAWDVQGCQATRVLQGAVFVECPMVNTDPVWVAFEVSEVIFPWIIFDDGKMDWQPFRGADFSRANQAYADYLELHHPDEYAEVCDPAGYEPGTVVHDRGFALTPECAALALPLAEDIAAWVETGQPE